MRRYELLSEQGWQLQSMQDYPNHKNMLEM
jgi:hypothetical protein